jgi:hypothetical protein
MVELNREELAWAAGFFDGEGSTFIAMTSGDLYLRCAVGQKDPRALERFRQAVLGIGNINQSDPRGLYRWNTSGPLAQAVVALLWTWLGPVKRDQARVAAMRWHADRRGRRFGYGASKDRTHCPQGHPYDEANTLRYVHDGRTDRKCRTCARDRDRDYYRRTKSSRTPTPNRRTPGP